MIRSGYSDRINHALAFAAKHHDQMVRRGTRAPYATHAANIGVILTRYQQPDDTVVAGILHNVIADYVLEGFSAAQMEERIARKFGVDVLQTALAVCEPRFDADGVELSMNERKDELLNSIGSAASGSLWVYAADRLHSAGSLLADLRRTEFQDSVWSRQPLGRENTLALFRRMHDRMRTAGFSEPIMQELADTLAELESLAR